MLAFHAVIILFFAVTATTVSGAVLSFSPKDKSITATLRGGAALPDARYEAWSDPSKILYLIDGSYTDFERLMITGALYTITSDMSSCIQFQEYNPATDAGSSYIYMSKTLNDGTTPPTCVTFFGRVVRAAGQGQKMILHNEPNGCMGSTRELMKVIVNALGLRNEYRRPDRDRYVVVTPQNMISGLQGSTLLTPYNDSEVYYSSPFDYHSLTILPNNKYAMPGKTIYSYPSNMAIPDLDNLSLNDCLGLAWIYGCDVKKCQDPYTKADTTSAAAAAVSATTAPATAAVVTPMEPGSGPRPPAPPTTSPPAGGISIVIAPATANATSISVNTAAGAAVKIAAAAVANATSSLTPDTSNTGLVSIVVTTVKNASASGGDSIVVTGNATSGDVQQSGNVKTMQVANNSNTTSYFTIYGPPGYTTNFTGNNSAVIVATSPSDSGVANVSVAATTPIASTTPARPATTVLPPLLIP